MEAMLDILPSNVFNPDGRLWRMTEKIPQHRHCASCNRAFVGEGRYCSTECGTTSTANLKRRKRQLIFLYVVSVLVLIAALVAVNL